MKQVEIILNVPLLDDETLSNMPCLPDETGSGTRDSLLQLHDAANWARQFSVEHASRLGNLRKLGYKDIMDCQQI